MKELAHKEISVESKKQQELVIAYLNALGLQADGLANLAYPHNLVICDEGTGFTNFLPSERVSKDDHTLTMADLSNLVKDRLVKHLQAGTPRYPVINLGAGHINVCEGISDGQGALMFATLKEPVEVGEETSNNPFVLSSEDTLAVVRFASVESLDVVMQRLSRLRHRMVKEESILLVDQEANEVTEVTIDVAKPKSTMLEAYPTIRKASTGE